MAKFRRKPEEVIASHAERDGNSRVAQLFRHANRAIQERGDISSVNLFPQYEAFTQGGGDLQEEWLEDLENLEEADYYVCSVCDLISDHKPLKECGRCQADPSASFRAA